MNEWMDRWNKFRRSAQSCFRFLRAEDLMHGTHISLKHNYLYVETPKVGCSTIKRLLIQAEYDDKVKIEEGESIHFREFSPLLNARQVGDFDAFITRKDIFKFCFVRNPYSRLLSCYLDKIKQQKGQEFDLMIQLGYGPFSEKVLPFEEFVDAIVEQPIRVMDQHWRIQYYMTFQDGIDYDLVGRFENFEQDLKTAIRRTGIDFNRFYQVENKHATNATQLMKQYYTAPITEKVYRKFKIDFEYFGYSKDLPS